MATTKAQARDRGQDRQRRWKAGMKSAAKKVAAGAKTATRKVAKMVKPLAKAVTGKKVATTKKKKKTAKEPQPVSERARRGVSCPHASPA